MWLWLDLSFANDVVGACQFVCFFRGGCRRRRQLGAHGSPTWLNALDAYVTCLSTAPACLACHPSES